MPLPHDDLAPVTRLYERLTEALQRTRRDPFNVPVTVAEVYQELVPYRLVRTEIGFDMNADYEHALLRLLAGEGECVRIEPPHAADEIRRELRSPNPNLSIYRDYAACDVWVRKPAAAPAPRRGHAPAPAPSARPAAEPAPGVRTGAQRSAEPKANTRAGPELDLALTPAAKAARGTGSGPEAESKDGAAGIGAAAAAREPEPQASPPAADWQKPIELQDVMTAAETAAGAGFLTLTPADEDRPADREETDDARAAVVEPMSETKREVAKAEDASTSGKTARPSRTPPPPPAGTPPRAHPPAAAPAKPGGAPAAKPEAARCAFCDSQLPQQRQARFCPYCGADQTTRPCPSCGEPVEPGWAFCITCGATTQ